MIEIKASKKKKKKSVCLKTFKEKNQGGDCWIHNGYFIFKIYYTALVYVLDKDDHGKYRKQFSRDEFIH